MHLITPFEKHFHTTDRLLAFSRWYSLNFVCLFILLLAIISRIGREFVRAVVGRGGRRRGEAQRNGKELCAYDIALQANEREFLAHETSPSRNISPPISTAACRPSLYTCSKVCAIRPLNRKRYKILGGEYVVHVTGDL